MTQSTFSSKKSHNYLALQGTNVDDMEFVEMFGFDPAVAYTPRIAEVMAEHVKNENIRHGMSAEDAERERIEAVKKNRRMMAKNGLL